MFQRVRKMLHCSHKDMRCNMAQIAIVSGVLLILVVWFLQEINDTAKQPSEMQKTLIPNSLGDVGSQK